MKVEVFLSTADEIAAWVEFAQKIEAMRRKDEKRREEMYRSQELRGQSLTDSGGSVGAFVSAKNN